MSVEAKSDPVSLTSPSILEIFGAMPTHSGVAVTPHSAMRVPAVSAAVTLIAGTVGTLPAKVFARDDTGTKSPDPAHPAHALVHRDANPWTSAHALRTQLTTDALLYGAGIAVATRLGDGRVAELHRIDPTLVEINTNSGEPRFKVRLTQGHRFYDLADVVHVPAPTSFNGLTGVAPIELAREAIALALTMEGHAARLFGRSARPSGVLTVAKSLTADAVARVLASWKGAHAGTNSGGTALLEEGMDWKQIGLSSVDAQFAELRTFQTVEIARAFRVPPSMIFEMGRATWANSEQERDGFLTFCLLPWLRAWEAAYRRVLLTPDERDVFSIEFTVNDLLRADTKTRAEAYAKFRAMGAMTANEVRARENLPAMEGGDVLSNPNITPTTSPQPETVP